MADDVLYALEDGGVAVLTLNRPERLNAWNGDIERQLFDYVDQCTENPDVKVIVITGAGRGFCAGADMDVLQGIGARGGQERSVPVAAPTTCWPCPSRSSPPSTARAPASAWCRR